MHRTIIWEVSCCLQEQAAHIVHNRTRSDVTTFDLCFHLPASVWLCLAGLETHLSTEPLVGASKTKLLFKMADSEVKTDKSTEGEVTLSETTFNRLTLCCRLSAAGQKHTVSCSFLITSFASGSFFRPWMNYWAIDGRFLEAVVQYVGLRGPSAPWVRAGESLLALSSSILSTITTISQLFSHLFVRSTALCLCVINLYSETRIKSDEVAVGPRGHQHVSSKPIISPACNLWTPTTYLAPAAWDISQQRHFRQSPFI